MSLLQGGFSLRRYLALGPVPEEKELLDALEANAFRPFQDGSEEERMGWVDWRNPLISPPECDWMMQDRFALFGLRIDTRRVPPILLKAHLELKLAALVKEKDLAFVGKEHALLVDRRHRSLLRDSKGAAETVGVTDRAVAEDPSDVGVEVAVQLRRPRPAVVGDLERVQQPGREEAVARWGQMTMIEEVGRFESGVVGVQSHPSRRQAGRRQVEQAALRRFDGVARPADHVALERRRERDDAPLRGSGEPVYRGL